MDVNSDEASEQYRKYVVEVILENGKSVYLLWGTNVNHDDLDYLLVNEQLLILAFHRIDEIKNYIDSHEIGVDPFNTKQWAKCHNADEAYASYNLLRVRKLLDNGFLLKDLSMEDAMLFVHFFNLFSDYAYQIDSKKFKDKINDQNTRVFYEYAMGYFFWDRSGQEEELTRLAERFDYVKFKANQLKMLSLFQNALSC